jgi:hypothetical protein
MDAETNWVTPVFRDSHLNLGGSRRRSDPPEAGRRFVAQYGVRTGEEDRGHKATKLRQLWPPNGVHASPDTISVTDRVQPPFSQPVFDRAPAQATFEQLVPRDDPMLFCR